MLAPGGGCVYVASGGGCAALQAAKLSAAAAAAEVQQAAATAALQDHEALLSALQKKLAQHDKQAAQHKQQVEDTHQLLRQLQETSGTAQGRLADARKAAGLGSDADARKQRVKSDTAGSIAADNQVKQHEQQLAELDCELLVLMARQAAAAAKATQAARSVEVLQQRAQEASDATAREHQLLAAAEQEVRVAAAAAAASRHRRDEAEQHWRSTEDQQQALTVGAKQQMVLLQRWCACAVCPPAKAYRLVLAASHAYFSVSTVIPACQAGAEVILSAEQPASYLCSPFAFCICELSCVM